jgi:hypothetical protein
VPDDVKENGSVLRNDPWSRIQRPLARCHPIEVLAISKVPSRAPPTIAAIAINVGILCDVVVGVLIGPIRGNGFALEYDDT